jgi:hypothetical protein
LNTTDVLRRAGRIRCPSRWARTVRRLDIADTYFAIAMHELAHCLDALDADDFPACPPTNDAARQALAGLTLLDGIDKDEISAAKIDALGLAPWHMHEAPYIRLAFHLWARAQGAGLCCRPEQVIQTLEYGLSSSADYLAALGREPERMALWPIAAIKATEPPAEFRALWHKDTEAAAAAPDAHCVLADR